MTQPAPLAAPRHVTWAVGLLAAAVEWAVMWWSGGVPQAERVAWDVLERRASPVRPDRRLVLVELNRTVYDVFDSDIEQAPVLEHVTQGYPWSREVWAAVIDKLCGAGARVVACDILFSREGRGDAVMRATLERWQDRVVLAGNVREIPVNGTVQWQWQPPAESIRGDLPVPVGVVNVYPDSDGRVRHYVYERTLAGQALPSLAGAMLERVGMPLPAGGAQRLRFPTNGTVFLERRSVEEVLVPKLWRTRCQDGELFRDKLLLIGPTASELQDFHPTPAGIIPGVEIHMHAVNTGLQGGGWRETGKHGLALALLLAVAAATVPVWCGWQARSLVLWHMGVTAAWVGTAVTALSGFGWLVPILLPLGVFYSAGLAGFVSDFANTVVERIRARRFLERYVSPHFARALLDRREAWAEAMGGERREVTVLFADLHGFTAMSEREDPQVTLGRLNEFFAAAAREIMANEGSLDKFIGDALMAVWGNFAPEGCPPERAVSAGVALLRELEVCNDRWREQGGLALKLGVGINTGHVIAGNVGSEQKADFTVVGDAVNLASRLQDLSRHYPVRLLMGEATAAAVQDTHELLVVDRVRVKGRAGAVTVSTVLGAHGELPAMAATWRRTYDVAWRQAAAGEFAAAAAEFRHLAASGWEGPGAEIALQLAGFHAERCQRLAASPPPGWDGVWTWADK